MLNGKVNLLEKVIDYVAESHSLHKQKAQRVWRTLSRDNMKTVDRADSILKFVNFFGCWNLTDVAAQHLAQCPHLQNVNFKFCSNLTDAAAQHCFKILV